MKKLALLILAAGAPTLAPQAASAQVVVHPGFGHGGFGHGGFNRGGFGGGSFFGGFAFGGFFQQPQYHVQNWQLYGFIAPQQDQRWVRYYDGDGDYHPDGRDYRRVESERRYSSGWDYSGYGSACGRPQPCNGGGHGGGYDRRYESGANGRYEVRRYEGADRRYDDRGYERRESYGHGYSGNYAPPPPQGNCGGYVCGGSGAHGYSGYQSGYGQSGYGYGHGGTVIVTETTVTPGQVVTEEIIEEVIEERAERRHAAPRRVAPAPRAHRPAPAPRQVILPRGDRG
jgi:hypothetical protein